MTITMVDACDPADIPAADADRVAGYLDNTCKWPAGGWTMFRGKPKVRITTQGNVLADVFDWERGTVGLSTVRGAILTRAGVYLPSAVYCSLSSWETAIHALWDLPVVWWVAAWGAPSWPTVTVNGRTYRAAAWQYASLPKWDVSHVDDVAWPVHGEPAP